MKFLKKFLLYFFGVCLVIAFIGKYPYIAIPLLIISVVIYKLDFFGEKFKDGFESAKFYIREKRQMRREQAIIDRKGKYSEAERAEILSRNVLKNIAEAVEDKQAKREILQNALDELPEQVSEGLVQQSVLNMNQELREKIAEYDGEILELQNKAQEILDHIEAIRALEKGERILNMESNSEDDSDFQLQSDQKQLMDELSYSLDKASAMNLLNTRK